MTSPKMKRSETIRVRVTPAELVDIDDAARRDERTRSAFVRRAALDAAVPRVQADHISGPDNPLRPAERTEAAHNGAQSTAARPTWWRRLLPARIGARA